MIVCFKIQGSIHDIPAIDEVSRPEEWRC